MALKAEALMFLVTELFASNCGISSFFTIFEKKFIESL